MIDTYFGLDRLGSPQAMFAALLIGALFGLVLERAGFGSSRRLAGIFYFRDMAVVKVMFSALVTAMIGLSYLTSLGWLRFDQLFMMPTVYGAQIVGGLLFGVGFVMSGWCPGTGVVGLASGRMDAFVFLLGSVAGAILFNELFTPIAPLASWGESGVRFVHESLGMSRAAFALLLTLAAVGSFWGAEAIERARHGAGPYWNSPFLRAFSVAMVALAAGLFLFPNTPPDAAATAASGPAATGADASAEDAERALWRIMGTGEDHMDPAELADRLVHGDPHLVLVDVRSEEEFDRFHIRGAIHVPIDQLDRQLRAHKNRGIIVLYSNGMTHPAQARDSLFRLGYGNVYILTDGLQGFLERCLKPASLRAEPIAAEMAARIQEWRHFFHASAQSPAAPGRDIPLPVGVHLPGLMSTEWLATNLGRKGLRIIDLRTQPDYNTGHVPGAIYLSVESLRGVVRGLPSMLLPAEMLARHFSQMSIEREDMVVMIYGERPQDATLAGMACERLGHRNYAVVDGGFGKWVGENRPIDNQLPVVGTSTYPVPAHADAFTVNAETVLAFLTQKRGIVLDVRPRDHYLGKKSEEARAGHIPGARNRPFTEDVVKRDGYLEFKPVSELSAAYAAILPSRETPVIVHCRTGHQASQTFFVLKNLLGYPNVFYYDAGWTEWAARPDLPIAVGAEAAEDGK